MKTQVLKSPEFPAHAEARLWPRFVGIGGALAMLGMIASANLMLAAIAATYIVGCLMFAGAVLQLFHAFSVRQWTSVALWMASVLLYLAAATIILLEPLLAASMLTLLLAAALAASGIMRIVHAARHRPTGWGWLCASGALSLAVGGLIAVMWPIGALWLPGLVLAVDLLFQGLMLMLVGFTMKSAAG